MNFLCVLSGSQRFRISLPSDTVSSFAALLSVYHDILCRLTSIDLRRGAQKC